MTQQAKHEPTALTALRPCPWCGGRNLVVDCFGREPPIHAVSCEAAGCMVIGPERAAKDAAAAAWNEAPRHAG